jgi:hypothetical protein
MAWASTAEVEAETGVTVDNADLAVAQSVIDIYSGRTEDAEGGLSQRDLTWLMKAVCWQAAWVSRQSGFAFRQSSVSTSQDGLSVTRRSDSDILLAPLAARALKNLSWKCSRTMRIQPVGVPRGGVTSIDYSLESSDDLQQWGPM